MSTIQHRQRVDVPPLVHFFSIESASPAHEFWQSLSRLLCLLAELARRKGKSAR